MKYIFIITEIVGNYTIDKKKVKQLNDVISKLSIVYEYMFTCFLFKMECITFDTILH